MSLDCLSVAVILMPKEWYVTNLHKNYSGFEGDLFESIASDSFAELLELSPEAYSVSVNGNDARCIIQRKSSDEMDLMYIHASIEQLNPGDLIYHKDNYWLIITSITNNRMYETGIMQKCNIVLNIKKEDEIIQCPAIVTNGKFNLNDGSKYGTLPDGELYILVKNNDIAQQIVYDYRFIIGNQPYKVDGINDVIYENLFELHVSRTQFNENDDKVNKVADNSHLFSTTPVDDGGGHW